MNITPYGNFNIKNVCRNLPQGAVLENNSGHKNLGHNNFERKNFGHNNFGHNNFAQDSVTFCAKKYAKTDTKKYAKTGAKADIKENTGNTQKDRAKNNILSALKNFFAPEKPKQPRQKPALDDNLYFIRMYGYDTNENWAKQMKELTLKVSDMISEDKNFDTILETIEKDIEEINKERGWYGTMRKYNKYIDIKPFDDNPRRGSEYFEKYKKFIEENGDEVYKQATAKPNDKYPDAGVCRIKNGYGGEIRIIYPRVEYLCLQDVMKAINLGCIKQEYENLKSLDEPTLEDINNSVATIHWLMAQGVPYSKGSDSIANVLTKSIYHSYGIKVSQAKEGKSFDFEAFYRDLDDYVKIYPEIFEDEPKFAK